MRFHPGKVALDCGATGAGHRLGLGSGIGDRIQARGLEQLPPPWESGIVARSEALTIGTEEFAHFLHARLSRQKIVETAWHLLLIKVLERRLLKIESR